MGGAGDAGQGVVDGPGVGGGRGVSGGGRGGGWGREGRREHGRRDTERYGTRVGFASGLRSFRLLKSLIRLTLFRPLLSILPAGKERTEGCEGESVSLIFTSICLQRME